MKLKLDGGKRILSDNSKKKMNTANKRKWTAEDRKKYSDRLKEFWKNKKNQS